ncbi:MAG: lysine exporter LysO family protein [Acidaminobacteraceae bacterium]
MTRNILIAVVLGILAGYFFIPVEFNENIGTFTTVALSILLFLVGIDLGRNKEVFKDIKKHGALLILIPLSVVVGSLIGGVISGLLLKFPLNQSLALASGLGWYSLSGILLTKLHSAELGTISFLSNVFRELLAFIFIPFVAKNLNHYTAIAPAGATAMDTTLPLISKSTGPEIVVMSFFTGAVLSFLVPVLVPFFYALV